MKTVRYIALACLSLLSAGTMAQTQYDATRLTGSELNGTARFVGMGGAMGALGADISTIGTNPAGIGLFRSNDISTSLSWNSFSTNNDAFDTSRNRMSFDQIGFVYAYKFGNETSLRYVNFGFNYHKSKNFNREFNSAANLGGLSQTQQMANMMSSFPASTLDDIYDYGDVEGLPNPYAPSATYPYLGVMGVRSGLVGVNAAGQAIGWYGDTNAYWSRERGGLEDYDFNISLNVKDRMYFGFTLGFTNVDYTRDTYYTEDIYDGPHDGYYELENYYRQTGVGVDMKLGAIFRPIEDSPFRFGVAIHTPKWFDLTERYTARTVSHLSYDSGAEIFDATEAIYDYVDGDNLRDYRLTTPWKFNVSAGTTIGNAVAVGAEYEYQDYSTSNLEYDDGYEMTDQNSYIDEDLKGVHTLRLGLEARVAPQFSLRVGYNFTSAPFKTTAYKALYNDDMRTDVEFENIFKRNTVTAGLGYRGSYFYADLAYKYDLYKSDFYEFSAEELAPCKNDNNRHQVLLTLGVRF